MVTRTRAKNRATPTRVSLCMQASPARQELEALIHGCFTTAYGAEMQEFLPVLLGLREDSGRLLGALGLREGALRGPMYLEHYLDRPVEQALAAAAGGPVARTDVVELGNLAVAAPGGARCLIMVLTAFLHSVGRRWTVFTIGPALRNAFGRLGIELLDLGLADPQLLPPGHQQRWGSYYDQQPRVMASRVSQGHEVLSRLPEAEFAYRALWQNAALVARAL